MSQPAGTADEYSRGNGASEAILRQGRDRPEGGSGGRRRARRGAARGRSPGTRLSYPRGVAWAILIGALAGAAVLIAAEFSTLYAVHVPGQVAPIQTVRGASNNSYALIPIAVLCVVLGLAAISEGGRYALVALGIVGLVALLIGLLGDLPDAQRSGVHVIGKRYVNAHSSPSTGMYLETLGAVIVLVTAGFGLLLGQTAAPEPRAAN